MKFSVRCLVGGAAACLLLCAAILPVETNAAEGLPSAKDLFSPSTFSEVQLSPDGDFVAMLVRVVDGHQKLVVKNLSDDSLKIVASSPDTDIKDVFWVNNQRLGFNTVDSDVGNGEMRHWPGLFAVNRDGTDMTKLAQRSATEAPSGRVLPGNTYFKAVDPSGTSDDIFVEQPAKSATHEFSGWNLLRLDTKTGYVTRYQRPGITTKWLIAQDGVPRLNICQEDGKISVFYMAPNETAWKQIAQYPAYNSAEAFLPIFFDREGKLYVVASKGQDTKALYRYDLVNNKIEDKPLISINGYDFSGSMLVDRDHSKLLGVRFLTDAYSTYWFDEERKKLQEAVDKLLPSTNNFLQFSRNGKSKNIVVIARSDLELAHYMIYDSSNGQLSEIGNAFPQIDTKQMSHQTMIHYAARDGLQIPAYLTLPRGLPKKNLPMVVLVHGGPYMRGTSWGWDPQVQFLASRGYAVLQPEFRGSTGFGNKFAVAGWKQWGLAMQNDVADGAKWAIAQGIVDPKRICIAGASYGGYATLMGLANDPDLFKCGIDWVGVADIKLMYKEEWANDLPAEWQHYGMPIMIGDPVKDAEQLRVTSPVNIADRIHQPILMAYGGSDRRVPIEHGREFRDAVQRTNDKIEWVEYPEEGHGWRLLKNNIDFWTRVEKFLDANIGH